MGELLLGLKALSIWSKVRAFFAWLAGLAAAHPLPALIAVLVVLNVVQLAFYRHRGAELAAANATIAQIKTAQAQATAAAIAARAEEEAAWNAKATEADNAEKALLAQGNTAANAYIADHGVTACSVRDPAVASGASGAAASPPGGGAAVSAELPADAVVVSARDVQQCTDATSYAVKAHDWAATINAP